MSLLLILSLCSKVLVGVAGRENLIVVIFNLKVLSKENSVAELKVL